MSLMNLKKSIANETFENPPRIKRKDLVGKPFVVKDYTCIREHQGEYDKEPCNKVVATIQVDGELRTVWFSKKCSSKAKDSIVDIFFEAEATDEPLDEVYAIQLVKRGMYTEYNIYTVE